MFRPPVSRLSFAVTVARACCPSGGARLSASLRMRSPAMLRVALVLLLSAACQAREFYFTNTLPYPIWVGSLGNDGRAPIDGGGWEMASGASVTQSVDDDWAGRFWARTGCSFDGNGAGSCEVGDCGSGLKCNGAGGTPPVTLVEVTLKNDGSADNYDISNVDGFNVMASMTPTDQSGDGLWCTSAVCNSNINDVCPGELQVQGSSGVVGCKSACFAFNTDEYCCRGAFGTSDTCNESVWPTNYPKIFKDACPLAYSYAYDDPTSLFTCTGTNYNIVFGG